MDEFEKVEKLRQRANVSYEEAKKALDEANGDVLDAMLALEAQGKVSPDEQSTHSIRLTTRMRKTRGLWDRRSSICASLSG